MLKEESLVHYEASFCYDAFQFCVSVSIRSCSHPQPWILPTDYAEQLIRRPLIFPTPKHGYVEHGKCRCLLPVLIATQHACSRCTGRTLVLTNSPPPSRVQFSVAQTLNDPSPHSLINIFALTYCSNTTDFPLHAPIHGLAP